MKNMLIVLFGIWFLGGNANIVSGAQDASQFFPIGLYEVDDPSDFPEIAKAGFNLVHTQKFEGIPPWGKTDAEATDYLNAAQQAGLRVLMGMPQEAVQNPTNRNQQDLPTIRARVNAFKAHPALWGWQLFDEPENTEYGRNFSVLPSNFKNAYNAIKQIDPLHPVLTLPMGDIDSTYPYLGVDMMMIQYSVIPPGIYDYPWDKLENLREASRSFFETPATKDKPFVWLFQAYNLANDPEMWPLVRERLPNAGGRYPTREEMRFMAYSGLIRGTKGIVFVCYKIHGENNELIEDISHKGNPSQWQAVSSVSKELQTMTPIFLAPQSQIQVTASPDNAEVEFLLKEYQPEGDGEASDSRSHQGKLYLLALNPKEQRMTITFSFPESPTAVKVLNESRAILPQANSFTDDFVDYGVHVYEVELK